MPLSRDGDPCEAVGTDGLYHETPDIAHPSFGGVHLWDSLPMCAPAPNALDGSWADLGCEPPNLDQSGRVDEADRTLIHEAWERFGEGAACGRVNPWCGGTDPDRNHRLNPQDAAFLAGGGGVLMLRRHRSHLGSRPRLGPEGRVGFRAPGSNGADLRARRIAPTIASSSDANVAGV